MMFNALPTELRGQVGSSIPKVAGSIPTVAKQTFQLARCGYTLRVTSQTSYSPAYITPTHTNISEAMHCETGFTNRCIV